MNTACLDCVRERPALLQVDGVDWVDVADWVDWADVFDVVGKLTGKQVDRHMSNDSSR